MNDADVIIVGGGVAGLSVAYFLSSACKVLVLEGESQPAYHSSGRSAALYIEGYEGPVVQKFTSLSHDFFFSPPDDFCRAPLVSQRGGLTIASASQEEAFERHIESWQGAQSALHEITTEEATRIVSALRPEWLARAALDPTWHAIDVHELLTGFQKGLVSSHGEVLCNRLVTSIERSGENWKLTANDEDFEAPILVNAAGAWADNLAGLAGLPPVGLTPLRRTAVIVPVPDEAKDWPVVHDCMGEIYFKPESPGLMASPVDETPSPPCDAQPEDLDVAIVMHSLGKITTLPTDRILHKWAGLRTFTDDRIPVVGFDPRATGFFWLAGQGGFGVQTSPALGEYAADLILARERSLGDMGIAIDRLVS